MFYWKLGSEPTAAAKPTAADGLNPCFTGSWVLSKLRFSGRGFSLRLNPCFTGSWVLSVKVAKQRVVEEMS